MPSLAIAWALRCSVAIRAQSLASMKVAPINQIAQSTAASASFSETATPRPPITLIGFAQEIYGAQSVSNTAPSGKMKLSPVANQIQCFVVALPPGIDVKAHAANQTMEL